MRAGKDRSCVRYPYFKRVLLCFLERIIVSQYRKLDEYAKETLKNSGEALQVSNEINVTAVYGLIDHVSGSDILLVKHHKEW